MTHKSHGKPVVQPKPKRRPSQKEELNTALPELLEQDYTIVNDQAARQLYARQADGRAFPLDQLAFCETLALQLDDQGIDATPDKVRQWCHDNAFKLKPKALMTRVMRRIQGSPHVGRVIIDLGNAAGQYAVLTPDEGVQLTTTCPDERVVMVPFDRQLALPTPTNMDTHDAVSELIGLMPQLEEGEALLFIAWLTYNLTHERDPRLMRVFLVLLGPQGSGKTSFCQHIIQRFLDPSAIGVQRMPDSFDDIAVSSLACDVPIFDNISRISSRLSDSFCQVATGSAMVNRKLFTNRDSVVTQLQSTLVFNGLKQPFVKHDLISRSLYLHFNPLTPDQRQSESEMTAWLDDNESRIMGSLLRLCVDIMREWPDARPHINERAVDFCRWLAAFDRVQAQDDGEPDAQDDTDDAPHGADQPHADDVVDTDTGEVVNSDSSVEPDSSVEQAYADNLRHAYATTLQSDPVAYLVDQLLQVRHGHWEGTPTQLLEALDELAPEVARYVSPQALPHNAVSLGKRLQQGSDLYEMLQRAGIHVVRQRTQKRYVTLTYHAQLLHASA
ncbi:hypothetical protein GCM10022228_03730 [Halomonas cibimaris]|uniref:ATP-binding protein n=1 Tax=Halomonas cibimaris TaxID=657012 RepID=A0ABP7LBY2_9GAMM